MKLFTLPEKIYEYLGILTFAIASKFLYNTYHIEYYLSFKKNIIYAILFAFVGAFLLYYSHLVLKVRKDYSNQVKNKRIDTSNTSENKWVFEGLGWNKLLLISSIVLFLGIIIIRDRPPSIEYITNIKGLNYINLFTDKLPYIYDTYADTNNYSDKQLRLLKHIVNEEKKRPVFILDAACGTGDVIISLKKEYPNLNIHGSDGDINMLKYAKSTIPEWSGVIFENPILWQHLATDNQVNGIKWDYIFLLGNSIPYLENKSDLEDVLQNIYKILNNDGLIFIDYYNLVAFDIPRTVGFIDFNIDNYIQKCTLYEQIVDDKNTFRHILNVWHENRLIYSNADRPISYNKEFLNRSHLETALKSNNFIIQNSNIYSDVYPYPLIIGKKINATSS